MNIEIPKQSDDDPEFVLAISSLLTRGAREANPEEVFAISRVSQFSRSALFAWFSSKSRPNGQASLMVYSTQGEDAIAWYASFRKADSWRLTKVKGIDQSKVKALPSFDSAKDKDGEP